MRRQAELIQVLFEILMSIDFGNDFKKNIKNSLNSYLRKLNCSMGMILKLCNHKAHKFVCEKIYSIPLKVEKTEDYRYLIDELEKRIANLGYEEFCTRIPIDLFHNNKFFYVFNLPDVGILVLVKNKIPFSLEVIRSIDNINLKFAKAILYSRQNQKIKESEKRFRDMSRMLPQAIYEIDLNGNFTYINSKAIEFFGYSEEKIITELNFFDLFHEDFVEKAKDNFKKIFEHRKKNNYGVEYTAKRKDGSAFHILIFDSLIYENSIVIGVRGIIADVTEQKKVQEALKNHKNHLEDLVKKRTYKLQDEINERILAEKNLIMAKDKAEESDRLKSAFLANMSHEIRTPMNAILGFTHLLREENITYENRLKFIDIINYNGDHLMQLINDIIDIAKIESNQLKLNIEKINITYLMQNVFSSIYSNLRARNKEHIELKLDIDSSETLFIYSDETRVRQILLNILDNAVKFTENGEIIFGYDIDDGVVRFYVKDTGIGIRIDLQEKVFKRFEQGDNAIDRRFGGAGLGLSICKGFTEKLGGEIYLESEEGQGTTFYLKLPVEFKEN